MTVAGGGGPLPSTEPTSLQWVVLAKGASDGRQQEAEREAARRTSGRRVPLQSGQSVRQNGQGRSQGRSQRERGAPPRAPLSACVAREYPGGLLADFVGPD